MFRTKSLLLAFSLLVLSSCSARMESAAVGGKIEDYQETDELRRRIRISWRCSTSALFGSLFSPTGEVGCNDENGHGEVNLLVSPEGTFEIPAFNVTVTKFFSAPSLYFRWEILTDSRNGQENSILLASGKVYDRSHFERVVDDNRTLRYVALEDACIASNIMAIDGSKRFPFDELKRVYPDSYNHSMRYVLEVTLKRDSKVITSSRFSLVYTDGQFCASSLGLFVPSGEESATEQLSYLANIEFGATVVYSLGPVDPASGQRKRESRFVDHRIFRKGETRVAPANRLPDELLLPISADLDVARQTP